MSVRRAMLEVSSAEFGTWMAFYILEADDADPNRPPTPDELGAKLGAWAASRGSAQPGQVTRR